MNPWPSRATRSSGFIRAALGSRLLVLAGSRFGQEPPDSVSCERLEPKISEPKARSPSQLLEHFTRPARRVPSERLADPDRLEREQAWQRGVVANLHVCIRLLPRLDAVEEVARVNVERVILFDAALGIHVQLGFDRRCVGSAAATASSTTRSAWRDRGAAGAERHAARRRRRRWSDLVAYGWNDGPQRVSLAIDLQGRAVPDEEHAPVFNRVVGERLAVREGHEEVVVLPRDRERVGDLFRIRVRNGEKRA